MTTTQIEVPEGTQTIVITRDFDATPEQLLRAHTDPNLLGRWLGPRQLTMDVERLEARHGGTWHYINRDPDGQVYEFRGVFHGDPSVEQGITQTFEFLGFPGVVSLESVRFEDLGEGRTRLHNVAVYPTAEARNGMAASGMAEGVNDGYEKLDELLAEGAVA